MNLSQLQIKTLRNLNDIHIQPSSGLNCLVGANGSGKTSILEAIHLLGMGRSFRASQLQRVIQQGADELLVYAEMGVETGFTHKLGFARDFAGKTRMKLNGEAVTTVAELAQLLPILLLYDESYALFRDSPSARRKWLDWGMFHVEPQFFPLWRKLQRILQQRNALLKQGAPNADIAVWDLQLVELGEAIHALREIFIAKWQLAMLPILQILFNRDDLILDYTPGWDLSLGLATVLSRSIYKDRSVGHTTSGPQRADINLYIEGVPAQHTLSLGQQKLLVTGIILSQAVLVSTLAAKAPLLLIDDLPAELDGDARQRIAQIIHGLDAQIFLTGIDHHTLEPFMETSNTPKVFHVEHGKIK